MKSKQVKHSKVQNSTFGHILKKQSIQVNIDNSSACRVLTVGCSKTSLQNNAIDVFNFCSAYNIKLISSGFLANKMN